MGSATSLHSKSYNVETGKLKDSSHIGSKYLYKNLGTDIDTNSNIVSSKIHFNGNIDNAIIIEKKLNCDQTDKNKHKKYLNSFADDEKSTNMVKITQSNSLISNNENNNENGTVKHSTSTMVVNEFNNSNNSAIVPSPKKVKRSRSLKSWNKSFSKENLTSDTTRPVIVRQDSARFHQSSPTTDNTSPFSSSLRDFDLKKLNNLDYLGKSKSTSPNSFKNLKYYARNLTPERSDTPTSEDYNSKGTLQTSPRDFPILPSRVERKFSSLSTFGVNRFSASSPESVLRSPPTVMNEMDPIAILDEVISDEQNRDNNIFKKLYPSIQTSDNVARYVLNGDSDSTKATDDMSSLTSACNYDTDSINTDRAQQNLLSPHNESNNSTNIDEYGTTSDFSSSHSANVSCSTRHTGWLTVKHILIPHKGKVELASRRQWHKYWVTLKDGHLHFYDLDNKISTVEKFQINICGGLSQAVPEHAKKEHVFCLSTQTGHAYLMQANSATEVENWIRCIHCECAMLEIIRLGGNMKNITKKKIEDLIEKSIHKRKNEIDMDEKMKKMADLQLTIVSDVTGRKAITDQILQWSLSLERNNIHVYRLRCYLSSLKTSESPNSHHAMSSASKSSKQLLSSLKLFNISSLLALVYARQGENFTTRTDKRQRKLSGFLSMPSVKRSGSFNEASSPSRKYDIESSAMSSVSSPAKSARIKNVFNSLRGQRGFDNLKGSLTGTLGRKKMMRTSVSAVFASSMNPDALTKDDDRKNLSLPMSYKTPEGKNKQSQVVFQKLKSFENYETVTNASYNTMGNLSDEELSTTKYTTSQSGSLDSLFIGCDEMACSWDNEYVVVLLPNNESINVAVNNQTTAFEVLSRACSMSQLNAQNYFIESCDKNLQFGSGHIVDENESVDNFKNKEIQLKRKVFYSLQFYHDGNHGLTVSPNGKVTDIQRSGLAWSHGVRKNDEILVLNGMLTNELSVKEINKELKSRCLRFLIRTKIKPVETRNLLVWEKDYKIKSDGDSDKQHQRNLQLMSLMEDYLESITVVPPPVVHQDRVHHLTPQHVVKECNKYAVPPPGNRFPSELSSEPINDNLDDADITANIALLLKKTNAVSALCRQLHIIGDGIINSQQQSDSNETMSENSSNDQRQLSDNDKLEKILQELYTTERVYVKDLECLVNRYIIPLRTEKFLNTRTLHNLLNSIEGMLAFQKEFLKELMQPILNKSDKVESRLQSLAMTFLRCSNSFKMYSSFCACHSEIVSTLEEVKSQSTAFREFLDARNPNQQHSSTLESYLIKPIQRILKYPLLLREITSLSNDIGTSKLHVHLSRAVAAMDDVARHINDMQIVHDELGDEFGIIMQQAVAQAQLSQDILPSLGLRNLACCSQLIWCNPGEEVFKSKKVSEMEVLLFGFYHAIVLLCRESRNDKRRSQNLNETQVCFVHTINPVNVSIKSTQEDLTFELVEVSSRTSCFRFASIDESSHKRTVHLLHCIAKASRKMNARKNKENLEISNNTEVNEKHQRQSSSNSNENEIPNNTNISDKMFYTQQSTNEKAPHRTVNLRRSSQLQKINIKNLPLSKWRNTASTQRIVKLPVHTPTSDEAPSNSIFYIESKNVENQNTKIKSQQPDNELKTPANNDKDTPSSKPFSEKASRYNMVYGVQPFVSSVNS